MHYCLWHWTVCRQLLLCSSKEEEEEEEDAVHQCLLDWQVHLCCQALTFCMFASLYICLLCLSLYVCAYNAVSHSSATFNFESNLTFAKCGAAQRSACVAPGATQCIFTSIHMHLSVTLSVCMHVYLSVCWYVYGLYVYMYVYSCT